MSEAFTVIEVLRNLTGGFFWLFSAYIYFDAERRRKAGMKINPGLLALLFLILTLPISFPSFPVWLADVLYVTAFVLLLFYIVHIGARSVQIGNQPVARTTGNTILKNIYFIVFIAAFIIILAIDIFLNAVGPI